MFLMHRVELKAYLPLSNSLTCILLVPNAPCGVESKLSQNILKLFGDVVPNAPCGVERLTGWTTAAQGTGVSS